MVAVVGATGTGKSDLAVEIALAIGGEIVNADASQLYRGMDIGTAKLSVTERRGVPHHQLDVLDVRQPASVAVYQREARSAIEAILGRGRIPILVGGSGLYVKAVLDPLEFPPASPPVRARLERRAAAIGAAALHAELADVDPAAAAAIHPANSRRVVRALEVVELTGRPFSATLPRAEYVRPTVQVGLRRELVDLDAVLARRVHTMMDAGLIEEVRALVDEGLREGRTARSALGYAQLLAHLDGRSTLEQAIEETITATRAFARRQLTWFRRDSRIGWLDAPATAVDALQVIAQFGGRDLEPGARLP